MKHQTHRRRSLAPILTAAFVNCVLAASIWCQSTPKPGKGTSSASKAQQASQVQSDQKAKATVPPNVPDVSGLTCDQARAILERKGYSNSECGEHPNPTDYATRTDPPKGSSPSPNTKVLIYFDVEVPNLKGSTAVAAGELLRGVGLKIDPSQTVPGSGDPGTILSQSPAPHAFVNRGTSVKVEVVPDKLVLTITSNRIRVADQVSVQASLFPPRTDALYTFFWGDNSRADETDQPNASHLYHKANPHYQVSASVADPGGKGKVTSDPVEVDVEPYQVKLKIDPPNPEPGERVTLTAELDPHPSKLAASPTEYMFSFAGETGEWKTGSEDTHTYDEAGSYPISVSVKLGGIDAGSSKPETLMIGKRGPEIPWFWIVVCVVGGTLFSTGTTSILLTRKYVRRRRVRRLWEQTQVRTQIDPQVQTAEQPSLVRVDNVVLVRAVTDKQPSLSDGSEE
jgi:PASTA domain-containing protein/PKD domain-containing protein